MYQTAYQLVQAYYDAFNAGNRQAFLDLLTENVVHDINQGKREIGKRAFAEFMHSMDGCYLERVSDLHIMVSADGTRAAAEFTIDGEYVKSAVGLPPAKNQKYRLPVGAFFEVRAGKISRVTTYYNLQDWIKQVS